MKLVSIYSAAGLLEADMLKAFLEAQGLQVVLNQESVGRTLGLSAGILGRVDVLVPHDQVSDAKALITAIQEGEYLKSEYQEDLEDPDSDDYES